MYEIVKTYCSDDQDEFRLWFKMPRAQRRLLNLQIKGLRRVLSQPPSLPCLVASVAARRREFSAACEPGEYAAWANFPRCVPSSPFLPRFPPPSPSLLQAASPQDAHQSQAFAAALVRAQQVIHYYRHAVAVSAIVCADFARYSTTCGMLDLFESQEYFAISALIVIERKTLCPSFSLHCPGAMLVTLIFFWVNYMVV